MNRFMSGAYWTVTTDEPLLPSDVAVIVTGSFVHQ